MAQIAVSYTTDEIDRAGAAVPVADAKAKMEALIAKASKMLEPLGVTPDDLRQFVILKLKT